MSFEAALRVPLLADAPLVALIGQRVRPLTMAQGEQLPYVAFRVGDTEDPSPSHDGPSSWSRSTFDLVIVAESYEAARYVGEQVRRVMRNYAGTEQGIQIIWTKFESETDVEQSPPEGGEKPLYVRAQTYRSMYRTA